MEENWNDKEFVLKKVKEDIRAIEYVSEELQEDEDILKTIKEIRMEYNKEEIEALKEDNTKKGYWIFCNIEEGFYDGCGKQQYDYIITDKDLNVIHEEGDYPEIEETYYENVFTVGGRIVDLDTKCAYDSWEEFEYGEENLNKINQAEENWSNKEYVLEKVKKNGKNFQYASEELKKDKKVLIELLKEHPDMINELRDEYKDEAIEMLKEYIDDINDFDILETTGVVVGVFDGIETLDFEESIKRLEEDQNEIRTKIQNACIEILETIDKKENIHSIEEIEDAVSDRKLSDVNKATSEIVQANEEKEQKEENKNEYAEV